MVSGSGESIELLEEHIQQLSPSAQIMRVTDESAATAIISEHRPELILVDTISAGMEGFAVCARLKKDDRTGTIPLICFYAPDARESRIRALGCGADGILPWPPEDEELKAMEASLTENLERHKKQLDQLENNIREDERLYDSLLNNIELISVTLDRRGRITFCNDYLLKITGWQREDILGADWFEIFIPPNDGSMKGTFTDLLNDLPASWHHENEILTRSGERRLISWKNSVLLSVDGTIAGTVSIGEDITERRLIDNALRESEEAVRESESKFRKIYEEGPYGMVLINREQRFMMANRTVCQILRYDESELLKMTFSEIIHPDDRAAVAENHSRLVARETDVVRSENRYLRKDGSVIWASVTVTSNYDEEGAFVYNLAIAEDITERRLASEQVSILNERLSLMVEAIQKLSTSATLDSIMKIVMDTARRLLNADGATFVLREGDHCHYADENAISPLWKGQRCQLEKCISGWVMQNRQAVIIEDVYADDLIHHENYRSTFVRSLAIAPIRLNNPLGAIGVYWRTIFAPSTIELQLLQTLADAAAKAVENVQLIEGLERTISDRTADLQAVNRELEAFTYSVSHDLRAPLRHMDGFAEVLMNKHSDQLNEEALRYLNTIVSSARKMGTLIDDLLRFSRTGRSELNKSFIDMNKIIDEVLLQIKPAIKDRTIEWKIESLPHCFCDQNLMSLVWTNLIENAVKYTRKKAKAVIIIGHRKEETETVYYIKDNGIGFDMKYAQKLFGVFQRMHSSSEFEGSGVGLANVRKIILRHGGKTWAEAVPEKGTTIFFSLPDTAVRKQTNTE